jgi:hypothetical protein
MKNSFLLTVVVYGLFTPPVLFAQNFNEPPVKTCTVASLRGVPAAGMAPRTIQRDASGLNWIIYADNDAINQSQQLLKIIQSSSRTLGRMPL